MEMKINSILPDLHRKFAEKSWSETFQLVRRCMDKPRGDGQAGEPLVRCLQRLHPALNVSSVNAMISCLEAIAKKKGMGFHFTESTCYLTADLFYLEVALLPGGRVEDVKLAPHGEAPASSESLLLLLRSKDFVAFSLKLESLTTLYNVPGDECEIKMKLLTSLQNLGKDLQKMSDLPRSFKDSNPQVDKILNGRIGDLKPGEEDCPMSIQFYISPYDVLKSTSNLCTMQQVGQAAQLIVGPSNGTHNLQMASLLPVPPQMDPQGRPVFIPLSQIPSERFPACFVLRLQPPLPMLSSFINTVGQITGQALAEVDLQWAPFHRVLTRASPGSGRCDRTLEEELLFQVPLPGDLMHRYVFPGAEWRSDALKGSVVRAVPFTHPEHVPALLELLRHQSSVSSLLSSCMAAPQDAARNVRHLVFEVRLQSRTCLSVTFHPPAVHSLAVLLVNVVNSRLLTCRLFVAGQDQPRLDEYVTKVMKRCMSIPVTMRALYAKMENRAAVLPQPGCPAPTDHPADHPGDRQPADHPVDHRPMDHPVDHRPTDHPMDRPTPSPAFTLSNTEPSINFPLTPPPPPLASQNATGPRDDLRLASASGSAFYVVSATMSGTAHTNPNPNTEPSTSPSEKPEDTSSPCGPVGVFPQWSSRAVAELI